MAINLRVKSNYGGPLVSQKYQPIETPVLGAIDRNDCLELVNDRIDVLRDAGKLPRQLDFFTTGNWATLLATEGIVGSQPPLVVISSNRSDWLASAFARGADRLQDLGLANFTDVSDLRAFDARNWINPQGQSVPDTRPVPPWYYPGRVNDANRRIYIMVHALEYEKYRNLLQTAPNIHVIGWSFHNAPGALQAGDYPYVGFGASRYAAVEFCKRLRRDSNLRWNYAWLVDDNVYHLNAFRGLAAAEAVMLARGFRGMGFGSETATDTTSSIIADRQANRRLRGNPGGNYLNSAFRTDRVLQQAVLWDIGWLDLQNLNFSPYFIASAEDTSITNYLDFNHHAFGITTESTILKQTNTHYDTDKRGQVLNRIRYNYERWYAITEGTKQVVNQGGVATPVALKALIVNSMFPVSQIPLQAGNAEVCNRAICQAAESIMAVGVKTAGCTPANLFQPNGNNQQVTNVT